MRGGERWGDAGRFGGPHASQGGEGDRDPPSNGGIRAMKAGLMGIAVKQKLTDLKRKK